MFGIRFIKAQPNQWVLHYRNGKLVREGMGLAFFYFAPTSSLVLVPMASVDVPFIFGSDRRFQEITIQGQLTYRVADPKRVSQLLNFALHPQGRSYVSDDPEKLPQRLINQVQVLMRSALKVLPLRQALGAADELVADVHARLRAAPALDALGVEVSFSTGHRPHQTACPGGRGTRAVLREADEALRRRNASVEQERAIKRTS